LKNLNTNIDLFLLGCDEKKRSEYHVEALMSYKRAAELDSRSWQTYYELGLQQAIMGDVISASSSVKRSIKLRGDFIPSWHLLALIQSAHQFNALPKSLQLIQAGLGYHMNMVENFNNEDEPDLVFTLDTTEGLEFFDRAEAYMCLRMSQTYFLETLEGAEAVLKIYPDLFDMYGKLSKKMNLDIAIAASEKESALGRRKSSTLSQHRQDSVKSLSHPRSRSNTINNSSIRSSSSIFDDNDSLNCSSFALPPTAEDDDDAVFNIDHTLQIHQESELTRSSTQIRVTEKEEPEEEEVVALDRKKSKHKQRRSISTTRQLMDDPLLSLHLVNKKKKEKKEPKLKKTGFLSFRSSISNNSSNPSSPSPDSLGQKKRKLQFGVFIELDYYNSSYFIIEPSSNILKETMSQEDLTSSSLILQESTFNMSSNNSVKPSLVNQQQQQSSYFSILPQLNQQDQQSTSSSPVSTVHKNAYYAVRQDRWQMILVKIWIMASATYTRAQRCDEAFKAIAEADQLTSGNNADVWHQIGLIIMRQRGPDYLDRALDAFKRALSIDPEHVATHTSLASVYLDIQQVELAEQLLERSTKGLGWNQTEAW
jgi:tetratricopeptide (TPR) repeat protein